MGNINIDLTIHLEKIPAPDEAIKAKNFLVGKGGGALNYSVAASRFGHSSRLIGVTSRVFLGFGFMDELEKEGVETKHILVLEEGVPGFSTILNVEGEQRRLITFRGANLKLSPEVASRGILSDPLPRIVHFASVGPRFFKSVLDYLGSTRGKIIISYDPGTETRGNEEELRKVIGEADIIFMNEGEAERVLGKDGEGRLREVSKNDRKIYVLKRGARGGAAYFEGEAFSASAPKINPVDTTGAGDAFDAAFNGCYIEMGDVEKCLKVAVAAGSLKSMKQGSSSSPYRREIFSFNVI